MALVVFLLVGTSAAHTSNFRHHRVLSQTSGNDTTMDDPVQRAALLELYTATAGSSWLVPSAKAWNTATSYCRQVPEIVLELRQGTNRSNRTSPTPG